MNYPALLSNMPTIARSYALFVLFERIGGGYIASAIARNVETGASKLVGQKFVAEADFGFIVADLSANGIEFAVEDTAGEPAEAERTLLLSSPYFEYSDFVAADFSDKVVAPLLSLFDIHVTKTIARGPNN